MCKHLQYLAFLFKSGCLHKCWHKPKIWIETWNTNIWLLIQTVYKIIHCITWHDITLPCIALHYKTWDCIALQTHCLIFNLCSSVLHVMYLCVYTYIYIYMYIYGKCLGFARNRNHDRQRIISIIIIIIIIIIIKPLLKIFNESRSSTGVGELNPCRRSSANVEV